MYFDLVLPNSQTVKERPCFCCTKPKRQNPKKVRRDSETGTLSSSEDEILSVGSLCESTEVVISMNELSKSYGKRKVVDSVNFNINKGEVIALVGPNGSGKSTLIHMLTGLASVSSGDAQIQAKSVRKELDDIRERCDIGLCQQIDSLNPKLTVWEHLRIVANLKDVKDVDFEIQEAMGRMMIQLQFDKRVDELS